MNEQIESVFVNTFIQKQYQERLLFELKDVTSKTRRRYYGAFKKFAHTAQDYVNQKMIAVCSDKLVEQDVLNYVKPYVTDKICYYMDECDGEEMTINEAVEKAFNYLGPNIIVYKNIFSVIKEETFIGAPTKIILVNN